jgi:hypothetical protein
MVLSSKAKCGGMDLKLSQKNHASYTLQPSHKKGIPKQSLQKSMEIEMNCLMECLNAIDTFLNECDLDTKPYSTSSLGLEYPR